MGHDAKALRLNLQLALARRRWTLHRRRCAACRRAIRGRKHGLCSQGRLLFYAIEAAEILASDDRTVRAIS